MSGMTPDPKAGPLVHSQVPSVDYITDYDRKHFGTYLSLLYAAGEDHSEEKMALDVLGIDAALEPDRARHMLRSHLDRARWLANSGHKFLLDGNPKDDDALPV